MLGYDVAAVSRDICSRRCQQQARRDGQVTQDTKQKTRNLELGGGLESGDGEDDVIGIEEQDEQVPAKGGRTHCGRPHEARSLS